MKRLKFETAFRVWIVICLLILGGTFLVVAQDSPTNAPAQAVTAKVQTADGESSTLLLDIEKKVFLTFGLDRVPYLQKPLWGNPRWQYVSSLFYIILAFYISKFLDWLTRVWLRKWADKTETRFDNLLLELLNGPVKIVAFVVFLHVGLNVFDWPNWAEEFLSKVLKIIVACSLTYLVLKAVDLLLGYWKLRGVQGEDKVLDEQLFPLLSKSLKVFVVVVATLVTLDNLGLDIRSVLTLGSVGALAVGLAAQDTLANLFGALSVFVDKPFRVGDRIQLPDVDGTVETIGLRSIRVRNLDGHLITVPNKTVGSATITNVTRRPNIKTTMNIGITYDTPTEKVKRAVAILNDIYRPHPKTHDLIISFNQFADSSLNIMVVHWWAGTDMKEYLAGIQDLNLQVKARFDAEGISFAFPSRTVYLKQDSEWRVNGSEKHIASLPEKESQADKK
jgi:MscS family membrane protein